jgi:hypothetical protein
MSTVLPALPTERLIPPCKHGPGLVSYNPPGFNEIEGTLSFKKNTRTDLQTRWMRLVLRSTLQPRFKTQDAFKIGPVV